MKNKDAVSFAAAAVPGGKAFYGDKPLALPKLNLQFLTFRDYLLRAFKLFRLEAAYEIRSDLADALVRMAPRPDAFGATYFAGWARMACKVGGLSVTEVSKPNLGEKVPSFVSAECVVSLSGFKGEIREEWESLREHDVMFLVAVHPPAQTANSGAAAAGADAAAAGKGRQGKGKGKGKGGKGGKAEDIGEDLGLAKRLGITSVRGCEVVGLLDEDGVELNDPLKPDARKGGRVGDTRTLKLRVDPAQYHLDMKTSNDVYSADCLNILVRRKAKENNFKAVLETVRDLMATDAVGQAVPSWLHDLFLGYGDPAAAHYKTLQQQQRQHQLQETPQQDETQGEEEEKSSSSSPLASTTTTTTSTTTTSLDFRDTFLDSSHVREAFPACEVVFKNKNGESCTQPPSPPYRISFEPPPLPPPPPLAVAAAAEEAKEEAEEKKEVVVVTPYAALNPGPYPQDQPKKNGVRFTPVQTEAIRSGMSKGLTMVVGPPGTGKTDVAVQIIANLYHNCPNQKTLIVTHSNAALNDLFQKIMERDVLERHLLRLGSGVEKLSEFTDGRDFSKFGRVNFTLSRREELLQEVQRLADSLEVAGGNAYTCEGAEFFHLFHVTSRVEKFEAEVLKAQSESTVLPRGTVQEHFPFKAFFQDAPAGSMWGGGGGEEADLDCARGCFRHLDKVFEELSDFRAFELLRNHKMRSNYLLLKQARIVAMTCTHAAITRRQLVNLGFRYDNLVMEEAAQVLELETVIPMLLQPANDGALTGIAGRNDNSNASGGGGGGDGGANKKAKAGAGCRLLRVCLIGDHHQLPPVVKNASLQKYCKLDQTLFTRFIRLGVPHVLLDQQGRARPDIAQLYAWRYQGKLSNLPAVLPQAATGSASASMYSFANPGFARTHQFVDVPNFLGRGESSPTAFFYQNLGEAEYVVATYCFMRLCGYPAHKISILTTYNGQKSLIRDVLQARCASHPFLGLPARVTTVDKYQGQQNDYVLLSLVRTNAVGHLRDVRRLVVALSRARLGLYVFGRASVFEQCFELQPAFKQLLCKPTDLQLVLGERWPHSSRQAEDSDLSVFANGSKDDEAALHTLEAQGAVTELGNMVQSMLHLATAAAQDSLLA